MSQRYSPEFKARSVRLVKDRLKEDAALSITAVLSDTALKIGISKESLRRWHCHNQVNTGRQAGTTREELAETKRLRHKNKELRRTNEILKLTSAFRLRTRPPRQEMIAFIDMYRDRLSVECLCRVMNKHTENGFLTSLGYRLAQSRSTSTRALRDEQLIVENHADSRRELWRVWGAEDVARCAACRLAGRTRSKCPADEAPWCQRGAPG